MNLWQTKGSGKHQTFLQKAIEGAVVNALGLSEYGSSKAKGKEAAAKPANTAAFCCQWDTCKAAIKMQTTRGNTGVCHGCGRTRDKALNPPLERCQEWAFLPKKWRPSTNLQLVRRTQAKALARAPAKARARTDGKIQKGRARASARGQIRPRGHVYRAVEGSSRPAYRVYEVGRAAHGANCEAHISEEIGKTFTVRKGHVGQQRLSWTRSW